MLSKHIWVVIQLLFILATALKPESRIHNILDFNKDEQAFFYKGFDLSSLKIQEDGGVVYKDSQHGNITRPVEDMLDGMNTVRLRLWVNPKVPYDGGCKFQFVVCWERYLTSPDYETYNLKYVLALAKRFHTKGYRIYLDYRKYALSVSMAWAKLMCKVDFSDCKMTQSNLTAEANVESRLGRSK